jgi:hypothetical protein
MGIAKSGLIGPFRKKIGPAIGRRFRGLNVITALHHENLKAPTKEQLVERAKFGLLNSFLHSIKKLVLAGFKKHSNNKYPLNVAYSYNYKHAFVYEEFIPDNENSAGDGRWLLNYPELVYSRGHVARPEGPQVAVTAQGVAFSWKAQPQSAYCQYSDMASFLIYNPAKDKAIVKINAVNRYALQYTQTEIPVMYPGDTLHCYMSFASADGKESGNSMYLGTILWENV